MYSYQGMGSSRGNVSADWAVLPQDFKMGQERLEVTSPEGKLVAELSGHDSEFGNWSWTYIIRSEEGRGLIRASCFGASPRLDLSAGLRAAALKLASK